MPHGSDWEPGGGSAVRGSDGRSESFEGTTRGPWARFVRGSYLPAQNEAAHRRSVGTRGGCRGPRWLTSTWDGTSQPHAGPSPPPALMKGGPKPPCPGGGDTVAVEEKCLFKMPSDRQAVSGGIKVRDAR
ncbi:hypothetical protein B296_00032530 [Ensete ventricosum]|uniref:Uncharacterized protein n=1 Tax=Ensete ventricosum TaxID=4639 RepID=A0A426YBQ4_ENSVE|nr:hypothetical protein B296_00032530 [Ensete ventricosum]